MSRDQRIELRVDVEFRQKLDELAADQGIKVSVVIRKLVLNAHRERFGSDTMSVQMPEAAVRTAASSSIRTDADENEVNADLVLLGFADLCSS